MARGEVSLDDAKEPETQNSGSPRSSQEKPLREISEVSSSGEISLFSKVAWWALIINLGVVAWGVFLRAMQYGDGCGSHWPLCDGNSTPIHGPIARIIEMSHRGSTSLTVIFAIVLMVMAFRKFPPKSQPRMFASIMVGFVFLEGLVGAVLVKAGLVANNASAERAGVMSFHVVATFLLMAATTMAAYVGSQNRVVKAKGQGAIGWMLALGFLFIAGLGVSGAISALGHTLDPVKDVLKEAVKPGAFWMVRLQPYHPYFSIAVGMYLVLLASLVSNLRPTLEVRRSAIVMVSAFLVELALGYLNIRMLAPVAVQMIHLAAADAVVVSFVYFAATVMLTSVPHGEVGGPAPKRRLELNALVRQYVALTKPRVISLLLFTTVTALFAAAGGWPGWIPLISVTLGGYLMAGAANAINMVVERDLDEAMARTRERPTVTENVPAPRALGFAVISFLTAFLILTLGANLLAACLAFAGLVFYVSVYTLGLKRRTYQNIVIGGAAGAFPPLVGWAASQGGLGLLAYYMFAIVFLWTPVHFWALAILIKDDYASAGVPMLPVVKGVRATAQQIGVYMLLTIGITFAPVLGGLVGWTYAGIAALLNVYLVVLYLKFFRQPERPQASRLFHYSMIYLALLFTAVAVDRALPSAGSKTARVESGAVAQALPGSGSALEGWEGLGDDRTLKFGTADAAPGRY